MDPVFQSYGENIRCLPGKSIYIALTKRINNKLFLIKTDHPDCPKYELDWLCLNWMNNAADIIVQSSKNTIIDTNLHVYPDGQILAKHGYQVTSKPRCCIIYATDPNNINYNSCLFTDPLHMMVYSKRHLENDFPVVVSQNFSIDFLKSKVAEKYPDVEKNPIVLIECGVTFFNLMMDAAEFVDILMITELEGDENHEYLVGEIKMEIVSENYEICHVSHTVTNESGNWKMIVFKKKNP